MNLAFGEETLSTTDIAINGPRGGISVVRMYRSFSDAAGPFGVGTYHNYGYLLTTDAPLGAAMINLAMPDGVQFPFVRQPDGTLINSTTPVLRGVVMRTPSSGPVELRWKDGTIFQFQPALAAGFRVSVLISIIDPNRNTVTLVRNPAEPAQISEIIDPVGRKLTLTYTSGNRIQSIADPIGRTVHYTYNPQGRLETVTDPEGGVTRYEYDAQNRLTKETDARGVVIAQNTYNADGRVIEQIQADGGKLQFAYVPLNPLVPMSPVLLTTVTDPLGGKTTYRFTPQGFLTDVTDTLGQTRIFELEPGINRVLAIKGTAACTVCGVPSAGEVKFTYDANGNVLTRTDALGQTTRFTYEPVFNKVTSITVPSRTNSNGETTTFEYDSRGNLSRRTDENTHTTRFEYNTFGLLTKITDPLEKITTFDHDGFGNIIKLTDPLGTPTSFHYDALSRQIETIDALGSKTGTEYDQLSRVKTQTNARNRTTRFQYDAVGNLRFVTDARNNTTEFTYDPMSRLEIKKTPSGKVDRRNYDFNGNLTEFIDRRGQSSQFDYDALNRLVRETYNDSNVERVYDTLSRLLRVDDSTSGVFTFTYDELGRTESAISPFGSVEYDYDPVGRVISRQVVGQPAVDYDYDPAGNLLRAAVPQAAVDFSYDVRDQIKQILRSNGVVTDYTYDDAGRVLSITHTKDATVLDAQTYQYDAVGNRTNHTTNIAQPLITQPVTNQYDGDDNRLLQNGSKTLSYDENGNLKTELGPEGTTTYNWDARNRLASIETPNGQTISFLYDFAGNLIRKSVSGASPASQEFILDELTNIAYQKNSDGSQMSILTGQSIDTHLAVVGAGGQVDFGLTDTINSTTATTDQNGSLGSQFFYEPFGQTSSLGGNYPFQFTGRVPVTGNLYHYRARYYQPGVGRFVSEDPIGFSSGDLNLYRYVRNSPALLVDPLGTMTGKIISQLLQRMVTTCGNDDPLPCTFAPGLSFIDPETQKGHCVYRCNGKFYLLVFEGPLCPTQLFPGQFGLVELDYSDPK